MAFRGQVTRGWPLLLLLLTHKNNNNTHTQVILPGLPSGNSEQGKETEDKQLAEGMNAPFGLTM
jgi:hypothetical protein